MFTKILVDGFKCFRDRTEVELRPLTLLAGANSSGKSSLIQPLLLLKQTLLSEADPGPLRLDGPNVVFDKKEQMFWGIPRRERVARFCVGVWSAPGEKEGVELVVSMGDGRKDKPSLSVEETRWYTHGVSVRIKSDSSSQELESVLTHLPFLRLLDVLLKGANVSAQVVRDGPFLDVGFASKERQDDFSFPFGLKSRLVVHDLKNMLHVPGLRGNPQRSYPIRSIAGDFPGLFHEYVATLLERWREHRPEGNGREDAASKIKLLQEWLRSLGLTRTVETQRRNEIELEIRVARTLRGKRGWGKDLINIADAGFGISQSLPVVVALLAAKKNQTVYIEQPEIHLHPDAQVAMAKVFAEALKRGIQIVAETHSPLLLLGIQKEIAEGNLRPDDVVLHWFERDKEGASHVFSTGFNRDGSYENPEIPVDFADVSMKLMREFLTAAANVS